MNKKGENGHLFPFNQQWLEIGGEIHYEQ